MEDDISVQELQYAVVLNLGNVQFPVAHSPFNASGLAKALEISCCCISCKEITPVTLPTMLSRFRKLVLGSVARAWFIGTRQPAGRMSCWAIGSMTMVRIAINAARLMKGFCKTRLLQNHAAESNPPLPTCYTRTKSRSELGPVLRLTHPSCPTHELMTYARQALTTVM